MAIRMPKSMTFRVELQDQFLRSPRGVRRAGNGIYKERIVDVPLKNLRLIIGKEVQDWLFKNVGYDQTCMHGYDRYYYDGEDEPSHEDLKKPPKVRKSERKWRKGMVRDAGGKYERYISFEENIDEDKLMEFLLLFGKTAEHRKK